MTVELTPMGRSLIFLGMLLFLIGLLQGALIPYFSNPRMGLSAHLAAVQSGMAMVIVGLIWKLVHLGQSLLKIAYFTNIVGIYVVWFAISLGAALGASRALPIAGEGFSASPVGENLVEVLVTLGAVATITSVALIVVGLYRGRSGAA